MYKIKISFGNVCFRAVFIWQSEGATSSSAASRPVSSPRTKLRLPARHYSSERDPYPSLSAGRDDNATETLPVRHTPIDSLNLSMTTPFVPTGLNVIDLGGSERVGTYSLNPAAGDHHPPVTPEGNKPCCNTVVS
jgi:hypothetical protein